ncbi:MAG: hypothetical protein NT062_32995, partial [Proteobacteria bacterium]|nr:hypothetical protein [Pseudomonadota bacterium]
ALAERVGAWRHPPPLIHAVRVAPWPVTSRLRIAELAARTLARVAKLGGPAPTISLRELYARLRVDAGELGDGYGQVTLEGRAAIATLTAAGSPRLDGVYSAKAAAAMLRLHRRGVRPLLMWASKSTTTLDAPRAWL